MPRLKQASKRNRTKQALPALGIVGISLTLAGGVSEGNAWNIAPSHEITLHEEEISDVSLSTFLESSTRIAPKPLGSNLPNSDAEDAERCRGCGGCGGCRAFGGCGGGGFWHGGGSRPHGCGSSPRRLRRLPEAAAGARAAASAAAEAAAAAAEAAAAVVEAAAAEVAGEAAVAVAAATEPLTEHLPLLPRWGTAKIRRIKPIQKPKRPWGTAKPVQKPKQTRLALSEYWQGRSLP